MKRKLSLLLAMVLAMTMVMGIGVTAFADPSGHDLVVTKSDGTPAVENEDYKWYPEDNALSILKGGLTVSGETTTETIWFYESADCDVTFSNLSITKNGDTPFFVGDDTTDKIVYIDGTCSLKNEDVSNNHYGIYGVANVEFTSNTGGTLNVEGGKDCMSASKNCCISGNLKLNVNGNSEGDGIFSAGALTIKDNACVRVNNEGGRGIGTDTGEVIITDNASLYSKGDNEWEALGVYDANLTLDTQGVVDLCSNSWSAVESNSKIIITNDANKILLRGYYEGSVGAVRFFNSDVMELGDDIVVLGSTNIDAQESEIAEEVELKEIPDHEGEFTYYIGDQMAKAVLFKNKNGGPTPGPTSRGSSNPTHVHKFVWQTITAPTKDADGLEGEMCSCGAVKNTQPLSAYVYALNEYATPIINSAKSGQTITFEFGEWNSFPKSFMAKLVDKSAQNVTFVFKYKWNHKLQTITIPAGTPIDLNFDWYGPAKMAELYGAN